MGYPGGKAGAGVYQRIINEMPPHRVYIEPFAGGAAIFKRKAPAEQSILIDLDAACVAPFAERPDVATLASDGVTFLESYPFKGDELVYCDPPYLGEARAHPQRRIYLFEMQDAELHARLLTVLERLPCHVMLSGYASRLYAERLADWRLVTFQAATRGKPALEHLWCNFERPELLHDWRYVGDGYRERERIARKARRWQAKFAGLPAVERRAVLRGILAADPAVRDLAPAPAMAADVELCPAGGRSPAGISGREGELAEAPTLPLSFEPLPETPATPRAARNLHPTEA